MIEYPDDEAIRRESEKHDIPAEVIVRDLVRIVEVLHLGTQGFFDEKSVLAGSMALRCANSPRFTVYDADFSIGREELQHPGLIKKQLGYRDDDLDITPSDPTPHDQDGTVWKVEPITYDPVFTSLAPRNREFKADLSFRGLVEPGQETELLVPYDLGLWKDAPGVWVMEIHEVVAEKTLGWCKHRQFKHYADLGFIAIASQGDGPVKLAPARLRSALDAKLATMKEIQPIEYAAFGTIEDVITDLASEPQVDKGQWDDLVYLRSHRDRFRPSLLIEAVQTILVPLYQKKS